MTDRVPDALAPPPGEPRFPALDGMRALAALSVLVFHAAASSFYNTGHGLGALTARADLGVTIFFLLSGFLLYRPFVAARLRGAPGPSARRFYRRRLLRVVPAYWAALVALSIWPGLAQDPLAHGDWWRCVLLVQNLSPRTVQLGIGPAWTLAVEMSFYALLPLYAVVLARRRPGPRAELALLAALFVVSLAVRVWAEHDGGGTAVVLLFTLPGFGTWFAAGMALAVLSAYAPARRVRPLPWWAAAVAGYLVLAYAAGLPTLLNRPSPGQAIGQHLAYLGVAVLVFVPAVFAGDARLVRALAAGRVATWLGLVSYGLYLYHQPLLLAAAPGSMSSLLARGGGAALVAATVSYLALERPLLRLKERPAVRTD